MRFTRRQGGNPKKTRISINTNVKLIKGVDVAIYEYYCFKCANEFELMRPISKSDDPGVCPSCGGESQKLVSAAASKVDYYIKAPAKPAFRQHPPGSS